jgi:hypothetical protein
VSTRRDAPLDVPGVEPPTRVLSARELREQLGGSYAPEVGAREPPTRPLSRAELEREIAHAEAAATDDADEAVTRWLPRARTVRRDRCVTQLEYALPARVSAAPSSAPHDVTITSLEVGDMRAEVPRLGARPLPPPRSTPAHADPGAGPEPRQPPSEHRAARPRSLPMGRGRGAALIASVALLLGAVKLGLSHPGAHRPPRPARAAAPARSAALTPSPGRVPTAPPEVPRPPGSPRRALDLLLGGQPALALDAYRALAHERPGEPVYAQLVDLLEREVRPCAEAGTCP